MYLKLLRDAVVLLLGRVPHASWRLYKRAPARVRGMIEGIVLLEGAAYIIENAILAIKIRLVAENRRLKDEEEAALFLAFAAESDLPTLERLESDSRRIQRGLRLGRARLSSGERAAMTKNHLKNVEEWSLKTANAWSSIRVRLLDDMVPEDVAANLPLTTKLYKEMLA